ncbi:MAG: hypothetical protein NTY40_03710, partial [Synechococcus sp. LacPavin_0920_WC12_MAG_50_7]|nr:hypothetical protein [Synechococcus sp. LacPavin_0920_WC12_MAG_50_7]
YLLTFGICGLGQLIDLFLIPGFVESSNYPLLLEEAIAAKQLQDPLDRQLLLLARRSGLGGFSINDAVLALEPSGVFDVAAVRAEIERLLHADLLDITNNQQGRVVYREP